MSLETTASKLEVIFAVLLFGCLGILLHISWRSEIKPYHQNEDDRFLTLTASTAVSLNLNSLFSHSSRFYSNSLNPFRITSTALSSQSCPVGSYSLGSISTTCGFLPDLSVCCSNNHTAITPPSVDVICPIAQDFGLSSSLATVKSDRIARTRECRAAILRYLCYTSCQPSLRYSCAFNATVLIQTCSDVCPGLTALLPAVSSIPTKPNCSYPIIPTESSAPAIINFELAGSNNVSFTEVSVLAFTFEIVVSTLYPPEDGFLLWESMGAPAAYYIFPVPFDFWIWQAKNVWIANRTVSLETNQFLGRNWQFLVKAVMFNTVDKNVSAPVSVWLNSFVAAPTYIEEIDLCETTPLLGSSSAYFIPTTTTIYSTLNCRCDTHCNITLLNSSAEVTISLLVLHASVTTVNGNIVVSSGINFTSTAKTLYLGNSTRVQFLCDTTYSNFRIEGESSSNLEFPENFLTKIEKALVFAGPTVTIRNVIFLADNATLTITGLSTVSITNSSTLWLGGRGSSVVIASPSATSTVLTFQGGTVVGEGMILVQQGVVRLHATVIATTIYLNSTSRLVGTRLISTPTTEVISCGDTISSAVFNSSMSQLTVDLSCQNGQNFTSTCGNQSLASTIINSDISISSGSVLRLLNVSSPSETFPLIINGSLTVATGGYLQIIIGNDSNLPVPSFIPVVRFYEKDCRVPTSNIYSISGVTRTGVLVDLNIFTSVSNLSECVFGVRYMYPTTPTTPATLIKSITFTLILQKDCSQYNSDFVLNAFANASINVSYVTILNIQCASTVLSFQCLGNSLTLANAFCQNIISIATTAGSSLNLALSVVSSATSTVDLTRFLKSGNGSSSNPPLFGLLAFLALPIAAIAVLFWVFKKKLSVGKVPQSKNLNVTGNVSLPAFTDSETSKLPLGRANPRTVSFQPVTQNAETESRNLGERRSVIDYSGVPVPQGSYHGSYPSPYGQRRYEVSSGSGNQEYHYEVDTVNMYGADLEVYASDAVPYSSSVMPRVTPTPDNPPIVIL